MSSRVRIAAVIGAVVTLLATGLASASADGADRPLTVMTFNIHAGLNEARALDLEGIAQEIQASGAEVVGLQEVDRHFGARSSFVDEPTWLASRLHMFVAYGANLDLDPLEPGQPRRQYGTAILSRYPILQSDNTLLPNQEDLEQRGLLHARINVRGVKVDVYNTHLQQNTPPIRAAQATRIVELMGARSCPALLTGDLNATPDEEPVQILDGVLDDSWTQVGTGAGLTYPVEAPTKRIDYVLHSAGIEPQQAEVLTTAVSDHRPMRVRAEVDGQRVGQC